VYIQKLLQEGEEGGMGGHHTRVKLKGEREQVSSTIKGGHCYQSTLWMGRILL
jgi:hypothetical protein